MTRFRRSASIRTNTMIYSPFTALENVSKSKDRRSTNIKGFGKQEVVICPICLASVKAKKATSYESGIYGRINDIKINNIIIGRHRTGGGTYSLKRGDILCKGFGLPVIPRED